MSEKHGIGEGATFISDRPIKAASMGLHARLISIQDGAEFSDGQQRVTFRIREATGSYNHDITVINHSGWQLGQEFDVVFRPVQPEDVAASVKANGF